MGKKKKKKSNGYTGKIAHTPSLKNEEGSSTKRDLKVGLGILALFSLCAVLIYGNCLQSPFIWDDKYLITEKFLRKTMLTWSFSYTSICPARMDACLRIGLPSKSHLPIARTAISIRWQTGLRISEPGRSSPIVPIGWPMPRTGRVARVR